MKTRIALALAASCLSLPFAASPAAAQARTWVSGVGDDVNPCSRTAPCKTFAGAISKTGTNGEINCLDPGSYGAVTITKSISINCEYTEAATLATLGTNGIVVNAPAGSHVYLRGLDIFGNGTGLNGIRFVSGDSLTVEDSVIRGFGGALGNGISFQPTGTSRLVVNNVTLGQNGSVGAGGGILIQPTGVGVATATINNARIQGNVGNGILVNGPSTVMIVNSEISNNGSFGIRTAMGSPSVRVGTTAITGNGTGVSVGAGVIESYCTNQLNGNGGDGAFFGACLAQK
jgi:hypothetical protein